MGFECFLKLFVTFGCCAFSFVVVENQKKGESIPGKPQGYHEARNK